MMVRTQIGAPPLVAHRYRGAGVKLRLSRLQAGAAAAAVAVSLVAAATPAGASVQAGASSLRPAVSRIPAIKSCPRHSRQSEHSQTIAGRNFLNQVIWKTTFHIIWCSNGSIFKTPGKKTRVTGIIKVSVVPTTTNIGAIAGWTYQGLVKSATDDYYWNATSFNRHSAEHSFREAKWQICILGKSCIDTTYVRRNMNVFWDATYQFYGGRDRKTP